MTTNLEHELSPTVLSLGQYAERHGKSVRTVQRWLRDELIPGATLGRGGWEIPADTMPLQPTTAPTAVAVTRATRQDVSPLGALGTLEDAAAVLGTTVGGVRRMAADGHLIIGRYGPRGSLRVYVAPR